MQAARAIWVAPRMSATMDDSASKYLKSWARNFSKSNQPKNLFGGLFWEAELLILKTSNQSSMAPYKGTSG